MSTYCPITSFEKAAPEYANDVRLWLENPHAYFKSFGPEARAFQAHNRSERLRTMTLVAPAETFVRFRPVKVSLDGVAVETESWETVFATAAARLLQAHPDTFAALQAKGELTWLGCEPGQTPVTEKLYANELKPEFASLSDVVYRIQWMFLMCGVRLNEVIVLVDPFTDETWAVRHEELRAKRTAETRYMEGRRAAQKAWQAANGESAADTESASGRVSP